MKPQECRSVTSLFATSTFILRPSLQDATARITSVKAAQKFFSEDKDRTFEAKVRWLHAIGTHLDVSAQMMDESARLLVFQQQLEKETDGKITFFGLSVTETIRTCLLNGMSRRADKIKSDFKVPDKRYAPTLDVGSIETVILHRFWYIKLHALTATRDFDGLDTFAKSKRSPIGYQPFVRHLVEKGHSKEAAGYVARCDANNRVDLYVECGEWRMAGKECKDRGDKAKIVYVHLGHIAYEDLLSSCMRQATEEFMSQLSNRSRTGSNRLVYEMSLCLYSLQAPSSTSASAL